MEDFFGRVLVADRGQEIRSLDITTIPAPPPADLPKNHFFQVIAGLGEYGRKAVLMKYTYPPPYGTWSSYDRRSAEGVVVTQTLRPQDKGRDYHVELPPGLEGLPVLPHGKTP